MTFKEFTINEAGMLSNIASGVGNFVNGMFGGGQQQAPVQANQAQQGAYVPPQWQKLQVNFAPGQRDVQIIRPTGGFFNLQLTPQQQQLLGKEFQPQQKQPAKPGQPQQPAARSPMTPATAPTTAPTAFQQYVAQRQQGR